MSRFTQSNYGRFAKVYEWLASVYSFGKIPKSKAAQIKHIAEGDRVLYAGAGTGEDAILAAKKGAQVTIVELASEMLEQVEVKLQSLDEGVRNNIVCVHGDVTKHNAETPYDVVVANYFLNVFSEQDMPQMFDTLAAQLKPEGLFMIADFAPKKLGFFHAGFQTLYFYSAVAAFRLFAGNAWHPLYDYLPMLVSKGFQVVDIEDFALFDGGPEWYRTICARKRERFLKTS